MVVLKRETGEKVVINPSLKGSISEHYATAWLLTQGYEVFRNVSPVGRADLLAVSWETNETIRVDVKSKGFTLDGTSARATSAITREQSNRAYDIKYLVVADDGSCEWYAEKPATEAANDNFKGSEWWTCPVTMQRFTVPGVTMSKKSWAFFCHWVLKHHKGLIAPISETFVRDIAARGVGWKATGGVYIEDSEFKALENLRRQVYSALALRGEITGGAA